MLGWIRFAISIRISQPIENKMHDVVIREARVLLNGKWQYRDIGIDEGLFSTFSPGEGKQIIDAAGKLLVPGGVDLHVHFNEPGRTHWEGFATGSLAAAAGGNTFLVEMPLNSIPSTVSARFLQEKIEAIGDQSHIDFGLWGGLVPGNVNEIAGLHQAGVVGFKAFMSPSGTDDFVNSDTSTLKLGMQEISKTGKLLAIHAEDPLVLDTVSETLSKKESALDWEKSRPVEAELSAVQIAIDLASETGCRIHIVHVSAPPVLELIQKAKNSGIDITCETCPHYLLMSIEEADSIGPDAKCAPPLRPQATVDSMWEAVRSGFVDTIGSDHSPCPPDLKKGKSFYDAWGGVSGLQHGLPLLWQKAAEDANVFQTLVDLTSMRPSELVGLNNKGKIDIGYDADFVLIKNNPKPIPISIEQLHYRHAQTAYIGKTLSHSVSETWTQGRCIYRDGQAIGLPRGKFLAF